MDETRTEQDASRLERQLAELSLIFNLSRSLSATLDLDDLLTQIVEAAVTVTHAEEGLLLLPDHDEGPLSIRAAKNMDDELVRTLKLPTEDSLAGQVMQTQIPVLVNNDKGWEKIKTRYLVKSLIYVPLLSNNRAIGVLGVDNKIASHVFTQQDQQLLAALASFAAIAIEKAQLYSDTVSRARELEAIVQTTNAISSSLDLDKVLNTISREITRQLEASWCLISLWDPDEGVLRSLSEYRAALWRNNDGPLYPLSQHPRTAQLLNDGQPFVVWIDGGETSERALLHSFTSGQMLALPLLANNNAITGLIEVYWDSDTQARAPETLNASRKAAHNVAELFAGQHTNLEWQQAVIQGVETILQATGGTWCAISLWDQPANAVRQVLEYGTQDSKPGGDAIIVADFPVYQDVLENNHTRVILRSSEHLGTRDLVLLDEWDAKALMLIPLVFGERVIGLLELADVNTKRTFTQEELKLATALSNQAAIAIENARLFGDLQNSLEELRLTQNQLVRSARMAALGELSAVVAHQINNPLTTIIGDAEMLIQDVNSDNPLYSSVAAIHRAGQRAKSVVDRLLRMARHTGQYENLDINETIQATISLVEKQIHNAGNTLAVDLAPDMPPVRALAGQLEDVWLNLLVNANDALQESGPGTINVTSALANDGESVEVAVRDDGPGIAVENLERIFDPAFTTKPTGHGTGLGLYICQQIVEDHAGTLVAESAPGAGAHMRVRLPLNSDHLTR